MYIFNPDKYLLPSYRISPFKTCDVSNNFNLPINSKIDKYFVNRFKNKKILYSINGRQALNIALSYFNLHEDDIVTIVTTSENFYISNCVTKEIEKFCNWNRVISNKTKIILVNHEFGFPYEQLKELKKFGLPIIEDCAHSFFSSNEDNTIGNTGHFVVYSFPKMFPIQIGGLLKININLLDDPEECIDLEVKQYIQNVISHYIDDQKSIINSRIENYRFLQMKFNELGFYERFQLKDGVVPGVFMFRIENSSYNLDALKIHFYNHGIECSVFYGDDAFFIPCHQNLNKSELEYFIESFKLFIKKN